MTAGKALRYLLINGMTGDITVAPYRADQSDATDSDYIVYVCTQVQPYDTKSGVSITDDEYYSLVLFSTNQDNLLSLAAKVRVDLDRAIDQTILGVTIAGLQYLDSGSIEFDDKTQRFEVEMRFKIRVNR
jgi:hypothetical protein